jgi:hypothetical protein
MRGKGQWAGAGLGASAPQLVFEGHRSSRLTVLQKPESGTVSKAQTRVGEEGTRDV